MEIFDSWVLAAAILAGDEQSGVKELHILELTDKVIATGFSILGRKGSTPSQTLGVILRKMPNIFISRIRGYYTLNDHDKVIKIDAVSRALQAIR